MVAAEAAPYAQVGGLGDVLRALPGALAGLGFKVRRFLPAYGSVDRAGFVEEDGNLAVPLGPARTPVRFLSKNEATGVVTTLVVCEELFAREGVYGSPDAEYPDNPRRFALLSRAVCERARRAAAPPDVLHAHDWHAALVPLFARFTAGRRGRPRTVLTIHNVGYQGKFDAAALAWLSLTDRARGEIAAEDGIEDHGGVNFLKAGLACADRLTTVSPRHAREIVTPAFGFGLDGLLRRRESVLTGILNGADYEIWNPARDERLPKRYGPKTLERKEEAKRALLGRLGLAADGRPVVGVVGRLARQKGIDVLTAAAHALLSEGAGLAVLGAGDQDIVASLQDLKGRHPDRIAVRIGHDEDLAHLIVAGSDLLAVPSRYEPCGLVQMHALRYGTIPVVHGTGGLADTVRDESETPGRGTGFVFEPLTPDSLAGAMRRALALRRTGSRAWRALQRRAMAEDFSWVKAAERYADLYRDLLGTNETG
jgi:starch synthase